MQFLKKTPTTDTSGLYSNAVPTDADRSRVAYGQYFEKGSTDARKNTQTSERISTDNQLQGLAEATKSLRFSKETPGSELFAKEDQALTRY